MLRRAGRERNSFQHWPGCFGLPLVFGSQAGSNAYVNATGSADAHSAELDRTLKTTLDVVAAVIAILVSIWLFEPPGWGRF